MKLNPQLPAWCLLGAGLPATLYLCWALHRLSAFVLVTDAAWPRPWPWPDLWLESWCARLLAGYPPAPGFVYLDGGAGLLWNHVFFWAALSLLLSLAGLLWLQALDRRPVGRL